MVSGKRARQRRRQTGARHGEFADAKTHGPDFERFGFPVPTDLTDVSRITAVGDDLILPALHTRSLARRSIQSTSAHFMPTRVWQASYAVAAADHVLEQLSTPWRVCEVGDRENELWAWQLREGLDSYARIAWCMRFGHSTAAVALTR